MAAVRIERLRETIAHLEGEGAEGAGATRALGVAGLDEALGGGLLAGALHEVHGNGADAPSAFGFALALAATLSHAPRPVLHVTLPHGEGEWGRPYGPGIAAFGFDPGRLLFVRAGRPSEALWAAEEALGCAALGAVILEIPGSPSVLDLPATRRLSLRAARRGRTVLRSLPPVLERHARAQPDGTGRCVVPGLEA